MNLLLGIGLACESRGVCRPSFVENVSARSVTETLLWLQRWMYDSKTRTFVDVPSDLRDDIDELNRRLARKEEEMSREQMVALVETIGVPPIMPPFTDPGQPEGFNIAMILDRLYKNPFI